MDLKKKIISEKSLLRSYYFLIALGVLLRLIIWEMNRGLFIDEANLARNIYERGFVSLSKNLAYEQFAPPLFLWISKLNTTLFGFDERVLRFYPLLSGILVLFLFFKILPNYIGINSMWYPLGLLSTGGIYLRYSTEFKQYMPDAFISLTLLYFALKTDIIKTPTVKFILKWILLGSLAIWASMPSVFILSAIFVYYIFYSLDKNNNLKILTCVIIGACWMIQFLVYYYFNLKDQIGLSYLQVSHQKFFLYPFSGGVKEFLEHNWKILIGFLSVCSGKITTSIIINIIFILISIVYFVKTRYLKGILLIIPGVLVAAASMLKYYSFAGRLMIFYFPLWLMLLSIGLDRIMKSNINSIKLVFIIFAAIGLVNFNKISYVFKKPLQTESVNNCLDFLVKNNIEAPNLYIHNFATGAYIYYTEIHPDKEKWHSLKGANQLKWDADLNEIFNSNSNRSGFISSSIGNNVFDIWETIKLSNNIEKIYDKTDAKAIIYFPKSKKTEAHKVHSDNSD